MSMWEMINRAFGMRQISLMGELKEEMFCIRFGSVESKILLSLSLLCSYFLVGSEEC